MVLDEFPLISLLDRNDQIDASLFPALAGFADESHWYRNTVTAGLFTNLALAAITTGQTAEHGEFATSFRTQPQNLFNLLGESHEIFAREPMTQMCPPAFCGLDPEQRVDLAMLASDVTLIYGHLLLPMPLRDQLVKLGARWKGFRVDWRSGQADETGGGGRPTLKIGLGRGDQARAYVDYFRDLLVSPTGDRPPLYFLHLMLPHQPWRFLPSGRSYVSSDLTRPRGMLKDGRWGDDAWLSTQARQRHLLQAVYTDVLVGQLLTRMKQSGLYHDALIVIAADHGIAFDPGKKSRRPDHETAPDILFVPLLIKYPGQSDGVVVDAPTSTLDILPTIASVLECEIPWPVEGRSLIVPEGGPRASFPHPAGPNPLTGPNFEAMRAQRDARVAEKLELFGVGEGIAKLYRIGEPRTLLGRRPSDFPRDQMAPRWTAWIPFVKDLENLDPSAETLPALIHGQLTGKGASATGIPLAISLGGRIEALTRTFDDVGRFTAMLPEAALVRGRNRLEVHRIVSHGDGIALAPVRIPTRVNGGKPGQRGR